MAGDAINDITQVHEYTSGPMMEACILLLNASVVEFYPAQNYTADG
jgi:hypothetical protein